MTLSNAESILMRGMGDKTVRPDLAELRGERFDGVKAMTAAQFERHREETIERLAGMYSVPKAAGHAKARPVYDRQTGRTHASVYDASSATGVGPTCIYDHCSPKGQKSYGKNARFEWATKANAKGGAV